MSRSASSSSGFPTLSRLNISHSASNPSFHDDEEGSDAWALDSDDEDFTRKASARSPLSMFSAGSSSANLRSNGQVISAPPTRTAGMMSQRPGMSANRAPSSSSSVSSSSSQPRRHAPPARPHPFPLPTRPPPSSSLATTAPTRSLSTSVVPLDTSVHQRSQDSLQSARSWTLVEDDTPAQRATSSAKDLSFTGPSAGTPPVDLLGESVSDAALRGRTSGSHMADEPSSTMAFVDIVAGKKKALEDAKFLMSAIRSETLEIVGDPFVVLERLSVTAKEAELVPTPSSEGESVTAPGEHAKSLGQARGFNDLRSSSTAMRSSLGSPMSSTSKPSRGIFSAPVRQDSFDPATISGDGLIMSSGRKIKDKGKATDEDREALGYEQLASSPPNHFSGGKDSPPSGASPESSRYLSVGGENSLGVPPLKRTKSIRTKRRWKDFMRCLKVDQTAGEGAAGAATLDLTKLRELAWNGTPSELRPIVWPLLLGYVPCQTSIRSSTLAKKRSEYRKAVQTAFGHDPFEAEKLAASKSPLRSRGERDGPSASASPPLASTKRGSEEEKIWHQISIDVPRTNPTLPLWQRETTQRSLERLLYVWAIRHHATGYVQGMSDLATPFFQVFLSLYLDGKKSAETISDATTAASITTDDIVENFDPKYLPLEARLAIEADTYYCLGKLLDGIQENYVFAQPGIQRQVRRMGELVGRIDAPLHAHLQANSVEYIQFAFRWMNCLLMREMSVRNVTRLWDTYLAEGPDAFSDFHLYVCSVFLCKWSEKLRDMDFQGCIMFLQALPTGDWSDKDAELLLSEAFVFKNLFGQTRHLGD